MIKSLTEISAYKFDKKVFCLKAKKIKKKVLMKYTTNKITNADDKTVYDQCLQSILLCKLSNMN